MAAETASPPPAAGPLRRVQSLRQSAIRFVDHDVWMEDFSARPWAVRQLLSVVRVLFIAARGYLADQCGLQASALTYITLMSMVPILALMFSVSKGMGFQERLMDAAGLHRGVYFEEEADRVTGQIKRTEVVEYEVAEGGRMKQLPPQLQELVSRVLGYVDRTDFSALGVIGSLLLFYTVVRVMGTIEDTFNRIWDVREARTLMRKFSDYVSVLIVVPLLVLAATSANAALRSARVTGLMQANIGPLYPLYERAIGLSGLASLFLAFTFLYVFMPNTKVRLVPGLVAGIVGGAAWYAVQMIYIMGQVGMTNYNAIYGTFAAIPIFLLWLYLSWAIVLFGAELAFALQHHTAFLKERTVEHTSFATREILGFLVVQDVCRRHCAADAGEWTAVEFARQNGLPIRLVDGIVDKLVQEGLLLPVAVRRKTGFVPARDPGLLTLADVERAFRGATDVRVSRITDRREQALRDAFTSSLGPYTEALGQRSFRDLLGPPA